MPINPPNISKQGRSLGIGVWQEVQRPWQKKYPKIGARNNGAMGAPQFMQCERSNWEMFFAASFSKTRDKAPKTCTNNKIKKGHNSNTPLGRKVVKGCAY